jgi:Domain of unknown function (DUF4440)
VLGVQDAKMGILADTRSLASVVFPAICKEVKMRRLIFAALALALLLTGVDLYAQMNAAVERSLESKEHAGWQAWKDHNAKLIEGMIPQNSLNIADGTVTKGKEQVLKGITDSGCTVNSFSLSGFSYTWLDKDTVVMMYTATQDATCRGKKQADKVIATSIWQKKMGKWISPFHQETAAEGM